MGNNTYEDGMLNLKEIRLDSKRIKSFVVNGVKYVNANYDDNISIRRRSIIKQDKNNRVEEC